MAANFKNAPSAGAAAGKTVTITLDRTTAHNLLVALTHVLDPGAGAKGKKPGSKSPKPKPKPLGKAGAPKAQGGKPKPKGMPKSAKKK